MIRLSVLKLSYNRPWFWRGHYINDQSFPEMKISTYYGWAVSTYDHVIMVEAKRCVHKYPLKLKLLEKAVLHTTKENAFSLLCSPTRLSKSECKEMLINKLPKKMVLLQSAFVRGTYKRTCLNWLIHRLHKKMISLKCAFASGFSNRNSKKMRIHRLHKKMVSI